MATRPSGTVAGGHLRRLRLNSPAVQVLVVGLICFCCPGMFNALSGLGGGGQLDHAAANNANTALYAAFALSGIAGGAAHNLVGPRAALLCGALTYALYAGSFLYYNHAHRQAFVVVAGGVLGVGAGLLWAAQGAVMTAYPPPARRATYIAGFWVVFNLGGVLGGLLPFALNYHDSSAAAAGVNDATYIAFMVIMAAGSLIALAILPARSIVRDDGSRVAAVPYPDARAEALAIARLFGDWRMLLLLPAAWASNFFYAYQFNNVNGLLFTLRTRGLNNVFYWGAQMLGAAGIASILDYSFASRQTRGLVGIAIVAAVGTAVWAGGLANQLRYADGTWKEPLIDFTQGRRYAGPFLLYFGYGLQDAMFQSLCYWVIGTLADDAGILSRYSGFYKSIQSAGAAVAWQIDTRKVPLVSQLIINWSLTSFSYPLLVLLVFLAVKDEIPSACQKEDQPKISQPSSGDQHGSNADGMIQSVL